MEKLFNDSKFSRKTGILLTIIAFAFFFLLAVTRLRCEDFWHYLKTGEIILQQKSVPLQDVYSFTANGQPWLTHWWLSSVAYYLGYIYLGVNALILIKASLFTISLFFLFRTMRNSETYPCIGLGVLALAGASIAARGIFLRPEIFSYLCIAIVIRMVDLYYSGNKKILLFLPLVMLLWANLHGGYILGVVIMLAFWAGEVVEYCVDRGVRDTKTLRYSGILFIAAFAVSFLTPTTYHSLAGSFRANHVFRLYIAEWGKTDLFRMPVYKYLFFLTILSVILTFRKSRPYEIVLFAIFGYLSLSSVRHVAPASLVMAPICARHLSIALKRTGAPMARGCGVSNLGLAAVLVGIFFSRVYPTMFFGLGIQKGIYPEKAARFIEKVNLPGQMFNQYSFGGYLIHRYYPQRPVFIDPRTDVYAGKVLAEYHNDILRGNNWEKVLERYGVNYALVGYIPLAEKFRESPRWGLVYWDDVAQVYLRDTPGNREIIEKYATFLNPNDIPASYTADPSGTMKELKEKAGGDEECFMARHYLGSFHAQQGQNEAAIKELEEAIKIYPYFPKSYANLGYLYLMKGALSPARYNLQKSIQLDPDQPEVTEVVRRL